MKKLGLIGGTSWVSTIDYYTYINKGINERLGGLNYAECLIYSFNFADIAKNNAIENWAGNLKLISQAALSLQQGGAEAIVLCANTTHIVADDLQKVIQVPIIHIVTATANEITKQHITKIGLLGTKPTMEQRFFKDKLAEYGIDTAIPGDSDRKYIDDTVRDELNKGIFRPETKESYILIIQKLIAEGAEGIILGCTEIPMLIKKDDVDIPMFDTTLIHSKAAVDFALAD